jgi:hypothetical protein
MPLAHIQVEKFLIQEKPDVVIYDVALPHASSWHLLDVSGGPRVNPLGARQSAAGIRGCPAQPNHHRSDMTVE